MYIIFSNTGNWDADIFGMQGVIRNLDEMEAVVRACEGDDDLNMEVFVDTHEALGQIINDLEIDLIAEGDIVKLIVNESGNDTNVYVAVSPPILRVE